jgi:hypothetical protein
MIFSIERNNLATVLLIVVLVFFINYSSYSQTSSGLKYPEINITYPENWNINGENIRITRTTIYGNSLFTVHCIVSFIPKNNSESIAFAKNVAKYAIEHGYLQNALLYNDYNAEIQIVNDSIGIGLVNEFNKDTKDGKGYAFNFTIDELFNNTPTIISIPSPKGYNENDTSQLLNSLLTIFNSKNYEQIYSLYSENALKTISKNNEDNVFEFYNKIYSYTIDNSQNKILVYIGNINNKNGYLLYLPIKLYPDEKKEVIILGYFQIMIADEEINYGIYNISVNFTYPSDYSKLK